MEPIEPTGKKITTETGTLSNNSGEHALAYLHKSKRWEVSSPDSAVSVMVVSKWRRHVALRCVHMRPLTRWPCCTDNGHGSMNSTCFQWVGGEAGEVDNTTTSDDEDEDEGEEAEVFSSGDDEEAEACC